MYNLLSRRDGEKRFFQGSAVPPSARGRALLAMGDDSFLRAAKFTSAVTEVEQAVGKIGDFVLKVGNEQGW